VCTNQALQQCENVPRQQCTKKHKKVPVRISKNIPKKVCDTTGYGYSSNIPNTQQPTNPEVVLDIGRANPNTNLLKNNSSLTNRTIVNIIISDRTLTTIKFVFMYLVPNHSK